MKQAIYNYLSKRPSATTSEIKNFFGLSRQKVRIALHQMLDEGKVRKIKKFESIWTVNNRK